MAATQRTKSRSANAANDISEGVFSKSARSEESGWVLVRESNPGSDSEGGTAKATNPTKPAAEATTAAAGPPQRDSATKRVVSPARGEASPQHRGKQQGGAAVAETAQRRSLALPLLAFVAAVFVFWWFASRGGAASRSGLNRRS